MSEKIRIRIKSLKFIRAGDLIPHPKNWRRHPDAQRNALLGVLEEVGYADAVIARPLENGKLQILDGHLRAAATPDIKVPVLITDLTEAEAEKLLATLDPLAAMAEVDQEALDQLLATIETESEALRAMLDELAGSAPAEIVQDDIPEPPDDPTTKPGDLWLLGDHRLLCGDSSKPEDLDRLLDGQVIDLLNTDPPYNVKVEPRSNNAIAAGLSSFTAAGKEGDAIKASYEAGMHHQRFDLARHKTKSKATHKKMRAKDRPLANDFVSDEDFDRMLNAWFGNASRVMKPGAPFYIWGGYANLANYPAPIKAAGLYFSQAIIWDKQHPVLTRKDFMGAFEICFYGWKLGAAHPFYGPNNATDLWHIKKVNPQAMVHLTEKPVELAARSIEYSSRKGENVLDLFGGSGSTMMACEQTGRRGFLMELDPPYCDVIVQRWENFTGRKAKRARN